MAGSINDDKGTGNRRKILERLMKAPDVKTIVISLRSNDKASF